MNCTRCGKPKTWHLGHGGMGMCVPIDLDPGGRHGGYTQEKIEPSTGELLTAQAVGATFAVEIGAGPTPVFKWNPEPHLQFSEALGQGRDIDDLALLLVSQGLEVEIVRVQKQGGCRLRDKKTGGWFIEEQGTGWIYLVKP
jgi:hypothetical protein